MELKIKLISRDTDLSKAIKMPWDVTIGNKAYDVYRVEGYYHRIGGRHGNNDLWCCPSKEQLTYANCVEYDGESARYGIIVKPNNYIRSKWDETSMECNVSVEITRNDEPFYRFGCRDFNYGIAKAQTLIVQIQEHPINFNSKDFIKKYVIGRKIWWRNQPAIIERWVDGQACIIVKPDFNGGTTHFRTPEYFIKEDGLYEEEETVKLDILEDKEIWWFRE